MMKIRRLFSLVMVAAADYVVRRRCDAAEMGRVAVAEVRSVPIVGAG